MCILLHDMIIKGKSFVPLHKDRDNFFANAIAINETPRSKQFAKWKITSFVLITRSKVAGFCSSCDVTSRSDWNPR